MQEARQSLQFKMKQSMMHMSSAQNQTARSKVAARGQGGARNTTLV
jgi:hypothetical protein